MFVWPNDNGNRLIVPGSTPQLLHWTFNMSAFDSVVGLPSRIQAKVHEMPLLFAAIATIIYWMVLYYRGQARKVITMAFFWVQLEAQCYKT
jgi:hypothetical protein